MTGGYEEIHGGRPRVALGASLMASALIAGSMALAPGVVAQEPTPATEPAVAEPSIAPVIEPVDEERPIDEVDLEAARARLAERAVAVERLLPPKTEFGARWLDYLAWDGVRDQLAAGAEVDAEAARETLRLLRSGADGLERPELQAAAAALADYAAVARFAASPPDRQRRAIDAARQRIAAAVGDPTTADDPKVGYAIESRLALLAGLRAAGRETPKLDAVERTFGRPNLLIEVEQSVIDRVASRPVNDCGPIEDCILGTRIRGTGVTTAALSVSTLPGVGKARLAFTLRGSTRSNTVGVNGPVSIRSVGDTAFTATKVVELSDRAFRTLPATASATTRSQTRGVSKIGGGVGSRVIERIAEKRVAQKRGEADAVASQRAEGRIAARLDEQLAEAIADARRRYDDRLTKPLRRRGATPRRLTQRTTADGLLVEAVQAGPAQLSAATSPPAAVDGAPIGARLHATAVQNLLDAYIGGATFRRQQADGPVTADVALPAWLKLDEAPADDSGEFKPWTLTLRARRPVSVVFSAGRIKGIAHVARLATEDKSYEGWDLIAEFEPAVVEGAWRLVQKGEIDVLPTRFDPERGRMSAADVGLRNNLRKAINRGDDVDRVIEIDPIDLTARGGAIRFLSMADLRVEGGWVVTGWRAL
ncbi:MAG: hypothetical protein AAF805_06045 [Planctomycetota bacterium]